MPSDAINHALLAVLATGDGGGHDGAAARAHITRAQRHSRAAARRERQIVEIAALVVAGHRRRAAGLAREHAAEYPGDTDLLARVTGVGR